MLAASRGQMVGRIRVGIEAGCVPVVSTAYATPLTAAFGRRITGNTGGFDLRVTGNSPNRCNVMLLSILWSIERLFGFALPRLRVHPRVAAV
jgi:hypothetical protein